MNVRFRDGASKSSPLAVHARKFRKVAIRMNAKFWYTSVQRSVTSEGGTVTSDDIPKALAVVFAREKNGFENAIADLTPNQLTVLRGLAQMDSVRVFTSTFMDYVRISSSGALKRALNSLVASRIIYQQHTEYKFANPFFREWLKAGA